MSIPLKKSRYIGPGNRLFLSSPRNVACKAHSILVDKHFLFLVLEGNHKWLVKVFTHAEKQLWKLIINFKVHCIYLLELSVVVSLSPSICISSSHGAVTVMGSSSPQLHQSMPMPIAIATDEAKSPFHIYKHIYIYIHRHIFLLGFFPTKLGV